MINILKREKETRWKDGILEFRIRNYQKRKNPKSLPEFPKTTSEIKNSLDGFNSGLVTGADRTSESAEVTMKYPE